MPAMRRALVVLAAVALLAIAGCGSSSSTTGSTGESESTSTTEAETTTSTSAEATSSDNAKLTKPKVTVPKGPPPKQLVVKDLREGTGATAKAGDEVTVQYVGVDYKTGKQFDASWDRGEPFTFTLGAGEVIPGWDQGVEGMKVGGRRELIIPPELAYGPQQVGTIAPNSTLVFVIDLLEAK
jgi:peptidylprolyl isomerase